MPLARVNATSWTAVAPRLADVIAGDRDRVPARNALAAAGEHVGDQPHGRRRRKDVGAARDVFLQDVVLHGPGELRRTARPAAPPPRCTGEQDRRGGVDRHRGRDAVQRDAVEELLHVVQRSRSPPRPCPLRSAPSGGRRRSPIWVGRSNATLTARSGPARGGSGSACWSPPRCRSPRTAAWSRAARGSPWAGRRACTETPPETRDRRGSRGRPPRRASRGAPWARPPTVNSAGRSGDFASAGLSVRSSQALLASSMRRRASGSMSGGVTGGCSRASSAGSGRAWSASISSAG